MVHLREQAQRSQAFQTNRNLVLDHGAHAESIPNLMIEANDVKCSHGSTVGPIDEEQMYYLATRGVSPETAEKLIVLGFFEDVFSRLSIPALIEPLRRSVNEKISTLLVKREDEQVSK
jgi:Fe-S cluster assembly protein SufD